MGIALRKVRNRAGQHCSTKRSTEAHPTGPGKQMRGEKSPREMKTLILTPAHSPNLSHEYVAGTPSQALTYKFVQDSNQLRNPSRNKNKPSLQRHSPARGTWGSYRKKKIHHYEKLRTSHQQTIMRESPQKQ